MPLAPDLPLATRSRGCLLAGAAGDALGAPVEFMSVEEIHKHFGPQGIRAYVEAYGRIGAITDDTQMTLFTAEGILRGLVRFSLKGMCDPTSVVSHSYLRWLLTQGERPAAEVATDGWLFSVRALHSARAPGNTCLSALRALECTTNERADNESKGAGGIMRIAPWAIFAAANPSAYDSEYVFDQAMKSAWITHGHPTGYLAAGAFAVILYGVLLGQPVAECVSAARLQLARREDSDEVLKAMALAERLAVKDLSPDLAIPELGRGWVAEQALAIALYCALTAKSLEAGIVNAVNITGDSDTTGSLAGQLLGAAYGDGSIPSRWLDSLELRDEILAVASDLTHAHTWAIDYESEGASDIWDRYPGC